MPNDKAPKDKSLMDFYAAAQERPEQFQQGFNFLGKVNDGISAAQRAAVSAAQDATSPGQVLDAAKAGFINPEQAASWQDIAKRAGVENKYGLMAAGVLGPMAEVDLIPGPNLGAAKGLKKELQMADSLQTLNKEGKLLAKEGATMASPGIKLQRAAQAEAELLAAQNKVAPKVETQNVLKMKDHTTRQEAKQFAKEAVHSELEKQPGLARDPQYLKDRIQNLFQFYLTQRK